MHIGPSRAGMLGIALAVLAIATPGSGAGEVRRFVVQPDKSEVTFTASFPLGNFTGRTSEMAGQFQADPTDLRVPARGALRVHVTGLRTGNAGRDRDMYQVLAADKYPDIRFTLERLEASFPSVTDRADVLLTIRGLLMIKGVERPITLPGRVRFRDDKLWVRGEIDVKMTDFQVTPPKRLFLTVGDKVLAEFEITLAPE